MSLDECDGIVVVKDLETVIEIPQSQKSIVEIEAQTSAVTIESCENIFVEIERQTLAASIQSNVTTVIEIEKDTLVIQFPDCVKIDNETPGSVDVSAVVNTYECAEQVNVNRVVQVESDGRIKHADKDTTIDACDIFGVSRQSGAIGELVDIVEFGTLTGFSSGTQADNLFLANNGQMSTTPPSAGIWLNVGIRMQGNEFFVNLSEPIVRN